MDETAIQTAIPRRPAEPHGVSVMEFAGFWRRVLAYLLDVIPITLLVALFFYLFLGFDETLRRYLDRGRDLEPRIEFLTERNTIRNLSLLIYLIYAGLLEATRLRGTFGKVLSGIVAVDAEGQQLGYKQAALRNAAKLLSFLPFGLGCLWIAWSKEKRAWHDYIAGTYVVLKPPTIDIESNGTLAPAELMDVLPVHEVADGIQSPETARRMQPGGRSTKRPVPPALQALSALASLRLTVILFGLSVFLVLAGTLAQRDVGIWTAVNNYFRSAFVWIPFQVFLPDGLKIPGAFPYPGGWLLGGLLLVNLLAAHAVRFKLSWKRSGIIILHAGIIVMMLGELVTGLFAVEANMTIEEGSAANYVEQRDEVELSIIDPSDSKMDQVVVIPGRLLKRNYWSGETIQHDELPFDVKVDRWMVNSAAPREVGPGDKNPATAGDGLQLLAVERPEVTGTDPEQKVDIATAYITLTDKKTGKPIGTYLLSLWFSVVGDRQQRVAVDGKGYDVSLRFKRDYKPYTIHLLKFTHELYPGTEKPKDFASDVRLIDPDAGVDREVRIYMNNPLYYAGETFYQSGFLPGDKGTILQVVNNPGWTLPYISCIMVVVGMLVHFLIRLWAFLNPVGSDVPTSSERLLPFVLLIWGASILWTATFSGARFVSVPVTLVISLFLVFGFARRRSSQCLPLTGWGRYLPWGVVGLATLYLALIMFPPSYGPDQMNLTEFGKLPIQDGGRVKPISTLAMNSLMVISDRHSWREEIGEGRDKTTKSQPAIKWLLDVLTSPPPDGHAQDHKVFRIENDQLLSLLDLKPRPGLRYSINEIAPRMQVLSDQANRARNKEPKELFDNKVITLATQVKTYLDLAQGDEPKGLIPPSEPGEKWRSRGAIDQEVKELAATRLREQVKKGLLDPEKIGPEEIKKFQAEVARARAEATPPAAVALNKILDRYKAGDAKGFNQAVAEYQTQHLAAVPEENLGRVRLEAFFNHFEPFYQCSILYVLVFVLAFVAFLLYCVSPEGGYEPFRRAAFGLAALTLVVHTAALFGRMYLMDRPLVFVTNLYSSAIFIGWGCVVVGLVLERIFRNGIGLVASSILGFVTLLIAHNLAASGDTLEMLQAVLDTNFWLATHVTCITIGYVATFVAGALGIIFVIATVSILVASFLAGNAPKPLMSNELFKVLGQMIYGVVCFATLLSFTGTVLGGIWADQSWGRFWGWDPKENGALMIVIWNALILHARWGGMVKQPGVALLAIGGNIITCWSWFGVNMLGVGLHSYGFMSGAVFWLGAAIFAHLALIAVGGFAVLLFRVQPWQNAAAPMKSRHRHAPESA